MTCVYWLGVEITDPADIFTGSGNKVNCYFSPTERWVCFIVIIIIIIIIILINKDNNNYKNNNSPTSAVVQTYSPSLIPTERWICFIVIIIIIIIIILINKNKNSPTSGPPVCFSGSSLVETDNNNNGTKQMSAVKVGENIVSYSREKKV